MADYASPGPSVGAADIRRLQALRTAGNIEADALTFLQGLETLALDGSRQATSMVFLSSIPTHPGFHSCMHSVLKALRCVYREMTCTYRPSLRLCLAFRLRGVV